MRDSVRRQNHVPYSFCLYPLQFTLVLLLPTVLLTLFVALPRSVTQDSSSMLQMLVHPGQKQRSQWPEAQQEWHQQQENLPHPCGAAAGVHSLCQRQRDARVVLAGRWERSTKTAQVDPSACLGGWACSVLTCHISWGTGRICLLFSVDTERCSPWINSCNLMQRTPAAAGALENLQGWPENMMLCLCHFLFPLVRYFG